MKQLCPLIKKECLEHGCKFFVHLIGKHPQTQEPQDEWDCTFVFLPILMIENSQQQRQTSAAVESFRNEMVKGNMEVAGALLARPALPKAVS